MYRIRIIKKGKAMAVVLDMSHELERRDFAEASTTLVVPALGILWASMRQVIEFP